MAQTILDPNEEKTTLPIKNWEPDSPLPKDLRKFGYFIDLDQLLPGDLILFSSLKPNFIQKAIRTVQENGGFGPNDARWEHAAVHIGSGAVCEATSKGVGVGDLYERIQTSRIRVRRNPNLVDDQCWQLALNALKQKNYKYSFTSILKLLIGSWFGYWKHGSERISYPRRSYVCSQLYCDAHVKTCGQVLCVTQVGVATPAGLSMDPNLIDVKVEWVKIKS